MGIFVSNYRRMVKERRKEKGRGGGAPWGMKGEVTNHGLSEGFCDLLKGKLTEIYELTTSKAKRSKVIRKIPDLYRRMAGRERRYCNMG
jgi:hypothetical protein